MKRIIIAIDGFSSCGKSTMAKALARNIGYLYFDSGAMYRAVALFCMQNGLISDGKIDTATLRERMDDIHITFEADPETKNSLTLLNGVNVEHEIRSLEVSQVVSQVAALDFVRSEMIAQQRAMGEKKGIVMDGRDIGTVVFPNAEVKIFLTATVEERAMRRYKELVAKGEQVVLEELQKDIAERDKQDMEREISPLRQAEDAIYLDTSDMTIDEVTAYILNLVGEKENAL